MLKLSECNRKNLCVDCDNKECLHHGKVEADCPKYHCDNDTHDCNNCAFIKQYQQDMRKYYETERSKNNGS